MESSPSTVSFRSLRDTPVTRQTQLSPEDTQSLPSSVFVGSSACGTSPLRATADSSYLLSDDIAHDKYAYQTDQDPFLSPAVPKDCLGTSRHQLSAKANIFEPCSVAHVNIDGLPQSTQSAARR